MKNLFAFFLPFMVGWKEKDFSGIKYFFKNYFPDALSIFY